MDKWKASKNTSMKGCPECGSGVDLRTIGYRRNVGEFVVRSHQCPTCEARLLSIQMLISPTRLLEMGISPLLTSGLTPFPEATPAARRVVAAG